MKSPRNPYAMVTPESWELIRGAYLSGQSASVVAARFGTTVHAIRKKAGREGWTKLAYARAKEANGAGPGAPAPRDAKAESKARVKAEDAEKYLTGLATFGTVPTVTVQTPEAA